MRRTVAILTMTMVIILYQSAISSGGAGRLFAISFPRNNRGGLGPEGLFLSISNYETSTTNFAITASGFSFNGTLTPQELTTRVAIPLSFQVISVKERNNGIRVEATSQVYVHSLSYSSDTSDSYLALPCLNLPVDEYEYFAISYTVLEKLGFLHPAVILIVACDDDTSISIGSIPITLNSMETYETISATEDLTGIRIRSSKPISVITGVDCTNVPPSSVGGSCDHLIEQVPPTVTWGSHFFVGSLNGRNSNQLVRVLSARTARINVFCNTAVSVSEFQLRSGRHQTFEIPFNSSCSIESTGPVLVAQYAYSSEADNIGDPFMMIIPPTEQYINKYTFQTYPEFNSHFTLYVTLEFYQSSQLLINEAVITGWQSVSCSSGTICGYITRMSVAPGVYTIRHQNPFAVLGVSVYGIASGTAYGMPVGMGLSPIQCNSREFDCRPICMEGFAGNGTICNPILCPSLTGLTNGLLAYNSIADENSAFSFNVVVTYTCDTGFSLVGGSTRTCTGDGSSTTGAFNGVAPTCEHITCDGLRNPNNGLVLFNGDMVNRNFEFGAEAVYSCDTGFSLVGISNRTCTGDGSSTTGAFNGVAPTCEPITCPAVTRFSNGSVSYDGVSLNRGSRYPFDVVATHTCNTGFSLVGDNTRTCTGDGSSTTGAFNGVAPTCERITCPSLIDPINGLVIYTSAADKNGSYSLNAVAIYTCDTGFSLVGVSNRTCTGDGSSTTGAFNGVAPTCEAITCPFLSDLANGLLTYSDVRDQTGSYAFNVVVTYSCNIGFTLVGVSNRTCTAGNGSSTTGAFNGVDPTCESKTCPAVTRLSNGSVSYIGALPNENNRYFFNVVATYTCDTGFSLVGGNNRTCTGDDNSTIGAFNGVAPACEHITCDGLRNPNNGFVLFNGMVNGNFEFGAEAVYSCDTGFSLVGVSNRTCTGDGSSTTGAFNGVAPTCEPVTCSSLTAPGNGSVMYSSIADENSAFSFNVVATYTCATGFSLVGGNNRTCTGDGSSTTGAFNGVAPTCEDITCSSLADLINGKVLYSELTNENEFYAFSVIASHSCDDGFSLVGNGNRTCTGDGSSTTGAFNGMAPTCEPVTCSSLTAPGNGSVMYSSNADENSVFSFNVVATYTCDTGFSLVGGNSRTCTGDGNSTTGVFNGVAPTCEPIKCPSLISPANGLVMYSSTGHINYTFNVVATYTCNTGFSLVGGNNRTCTRDGSSTIGAFNGVAPTCELVLSNPSSVVSKVILPIVGVMCGVFLVLLVGAVYGYIRVITGLLKKKKPDSGNMKLIT